MKITVALIWNDTQAWTKEFDRATHPTMMWIRTLLRQVAYEGSVEKMRIDVEWTISSTHMEITHNDKWYLTYVEDELFCDSTIEFDNRNELIKFIKDILENLESTERAEEEWSEW